MLQNKTIEVFAKLTREQMQKLRDFIASPYHNANESLVVLFDYLHKQYPAFEKSKMKDAAIIKNAKLKCSSGELRNKMTKLLHLTEDFLSFEYDRNPEFRKLNIMQAYKKLRLSGHLESLVGRLQKELDTARHRDFNYWWHKHRFEDERVEGFTNKIQRTADKTMAPAIESLDYFHAVRKLRYMCDQVNIKNQLGNPYADKFKQETLAFIQSADLSDPYLAAYSRIYLCFVEEDEKKANAYFFELKKIVPKIKNIFPKSELRAIVSYMEIYCSNQANKGQLQFVGEYIEIIRFKIEKNILLQEGEISPLIYKNVITAALKLGEFAWTEKFIHDYIANIPLDYQEDHYNYNMAQLRYFQGKQADAIDYLKHVSHGKLDIMFSFAVRKLLLRAEIEIGATELVHEHIEAYKKHLFRKKKDVGGYAPMLGLFIVQLEKLFKASPAQREKVISEIQAAEKYAEKDWLLRMAKEKKL